MADVEQCVARIATLAADFSNVGGRIEVVEAATWKSRRLVAEVPPHELRPQFVREIFVVAAIGKSVGHRLLIARSDDGRLAGVTTIRPTDPPVVVELGALEQVRGTGTTMLVVAALLWGTQHGLHVQSPVPAVDFYERLGMDNCWSHVCEWSPDMVARIEESVRHLDLLNRLERIDGIGDAEGIDG
ncbi:MAG: hypothetical protein E6J41_10540 [Chloroflexi bacterium]|nr:MAG: hypothetical protein E6J41_10540 [Chloroflexota bacterium]